MSKRACFVVIFVLLASIVYAEDLGEEELFQDIPAIEVSETEEMPETTASTKFQTSDIDEYVNAYKSEMDTVINSAGNNMVGLAYDVYNNFDGFTFYDIGEIIDTRGNRQKLYELWKDDEVFIGTEGIVVNDHTANEVVYTLSNGNNGISRTNEGTEISSDGATKVDKVASNVVIMDDEQILSGPGTDFFVPEQEVIHTNSKYTYNLDNRVGVIPNYGGIESDYFQPFSFGPTGLMMSDVTGRVAAPATLTHNLLVDIFYDAGMSAGALLRKNSVAVDPRGTKYRIKANCCSYLYLADTTEEKAFPFIARNRLKGDTGIVLDKDVKIHESYEVTDGRYEYQIVPSPFGTVVKTSKGKVIQSSNMLPYSPRNDKEKTLLELR